MLTVALVVVVIVALYLAKAVLMPLALATLLTFILAPWVDRLERWHVGRVASILTVVCAAFAVLLAIGWIMADQMVELADKLPVYRQNIAARINELKSSGEGPLKEIERTVETLSAEISRSKPDSEKQKDESSSAAPPGNGQSTDSGEPEPIAVRVVETATSPIALVGEIIPGAFGWLATLGVVTVFLIFMLLDREDLRNRLIRLIGPDQITVTTQALDDAGRRVSRYLRMQLLINSLHGLMIAIGLSIIGLPNAVLWGLLAGLLRYVPYLGPWMGASIAILLSLAVFPGWTLPLATLALFVVAELIVNNLLEPVLYHTSTGISAIGIILAAVFWTWLWGPLGLVLSTPMTVCIVVWSRYVPQLEFLHVMFSEEAALAPGTHLYQRLLASDEEESRELVEEFLKEHTVEELFEEVLLPALVLTEQDGHRGILEESRREYILENLRDLLDELPDLAPADVKTEAADTPPPPQRGSVVIVPARDAADEIAGQMLKVQLADRRIEADVLPAKILFGETVEAISKAASPIVVVSAVPPFAVRHARGLSKRLRSRLEGLNILVAVWGSARDDNRIGERLRAAGADHVVNHLAPAVEYVERHRASRAAQQGSNAIAAEAVSHGDGGQR
jgi:predicted PurR-regulated permease PerM